MHRRDFLRSAGVVSASLAFPKAARLFALGETPGWRTFEVTTRVEVLKPCWTKLVRLPAALIRETPYQKTFANDFRAEGGTAEIVERKADALGIVSAKFPAGVKPVLTLTSKVATRNAAVDLSVPGKAPSGPRGAGQFPAADQAHAHRRPRAEGDRDHEGAATDMEKARAIYEVDRRQHVSNPRRAAAASAISASCWSRRTWATSAPISCPLRRPRARSLRARRVRNPRGRSELGYRAWGPRRRT